MNNKDLALYLRCSNCAPNERYRECDKTCPYFIMEEIKPELPVPYDIEENGKKYWTGCDYERIAKDAAEYIESLGTLLKQIKWERDIAISQLKELGLGLRERTDVLLEKIEKQTAKEPILIEDKMYQCPVCHNNLMFKYSRYPDILMPREAGTNHCSCCVQKIDWSEV